MQATGLVTPWLAWRALMSIVRHEGFLIATALHLAVLATFVLVWGEGIPVWRDDPVLTQFLRIDMAMLAVILPWVAIRCGPDQGRSALTRVAARTACSPSRLVAAEAAGIGGALLLLALSALPIFVLTQQISAVPASMVLRALLPVVALAIVVAAMAVAASVYLESRFSSWIVVTAATLVSVGLVSTTAQGVASMLVVGGLAAIIMMTSAERRLRYLGESEQV
jgi:hypothetical protein